MTLKVGRPQTIGGVLDHAFRLYFRTFRAVWILALGGSLVWLPVSILVLWALQTTSGVFTMPLWLWSVLLVAGLISVWCYTAQMWRIHALVEETPLPLGASLVASLAKLPTVVVASVAYFILLGLVGVGLTIAGVLVIDPSSLLARAALVLVLLIPAAVLYVSLYFYLPVMVVDGAGAFASLARSGSLVRGNWFRAATTLTVGTILWMVLYIVAGFLGEVAGAPFGDGLIGFFIAQAVTLLASGLVLPFLAALSLAIYYDLKLRREGGDLLARAQAVGAA